jgi:hypothetical protein
VKAPRDEVPGKDRDCVLMKYITENMGCKEKSANFLIYMVSARENKNI